MLESDQPSESNVTHSLLRLFDTGRRKCRRAPGHTIVARQQRKLDAACQNPRQLRKQPLCAKRQFTKARAKPPDNLQVRRQPSHRQREHDDVYGQPQPAGEAQRVIQQRAHHCHRQQRRAATGDRTYEQQEPCALSNSFELSYYVLHWVISMGLYES